MEISKNFYEGAKVASKYSYYNAVSVLIIHSAIAYSDAVTIKNGGDKIQGDSHYDIISLLDDLISSSLDKKKAFVQLKNIIDHKNIVPYSGDVYHNKDIDQL